MTAAEHGNGTAIPRSIAVLGAGLMGHAIAYTAAAHDFPVAVYDPSQAALDTLHGRLQACDTPYGRGFRDVTATDVLAEAVRGVDLVFEAVPEDLGLKTDLLSAVYALNPGAILASNTSVIPIRDIEEGLPDGAAVIGTHWWNPAHLMRVVEVVSGRHTDAAVTQAVTELLVTLGKTPVLVGDAPGFVGNRLQFALWREAMTIVDAGIADAETVDLIARETFGRRLPVLGPLENADYIGLPLTEQIMSYVLPHLSDSPKPPPGLTERIALGKNGSRTGSGFLEWPAGRVSEVRDRLDRQLQPTREDAT
ncbi:3-hydroxyacyl-CoA dehydrogenase family protein [Mycolicibacterium tokaiense]|uniref:3-hydroxybutyryl-CoA dehydrogenase n=1 Tax=Mycolicibacterium tokaiense TaxID=39695 RepID=A0A378TGU6_9MYCO|nr:3-hydroxyacyl-CoA dehydrogenase family protein [Mycolicibacterium tokaiense]BBY85481.1 3-hydroxybutyryl-CoA dehydrogenase FadB [Mycolicibacterium tokaiense]STZ60008.1 3-hydroxybutyryl-CoA dehydrogenase [Mycolicibacterium tokaiense]